MFLDVAYFDGELSIPNAKRNNAPGAASILQAVGEHALDWYLEKFEHKCLVELSINALLNLWGKICIPGLFKA